MRIVKTARKRHTCPISLDASRFRDFQQIRSVPLLAIEVDGIAYHEQNEKQKEKDSIKSEAIFLVGCFF